MLAPKIVLFTLLASVSAFPPPWWEDYPIPSDTPSSPSNQPLCPVSGVSPGVKATFYELRRVGDLDDDFFEGGFREGRKLDEKNNILNMNYHAEAKKWERVPNAVVIYGTVLPQGHVIVLEGTFTAKEDGDYFVSVQSNGFHNVIFSRGIPCDADPNAGQSGGLYMRGVKLPGASPYSDISDGRRVHFKKGLSYNFKAVIGSRENPSLFQIRAYTPLGHFIDDFATEITQGEFHGNGFSLISSSVSSLVPSSITSSAPSSITSSVSSLVPSRELDDSFPEDRS